eukprot:501565-Prorocentrum_minimum.AAC.5
MCDRKGLNPGRSVAVASSDEEAALTARQRRRRRQQQQQQQQQQRVSAQMREFSVQERDERQPRDTNDNGNDDEVVLVTSGQTVVEESLALNALSGEKCDCPICECLSRVAQAPESTVGQPSGSLSAGNIRRIDSVEYSKCCALNGIILVSTVDDCRLPGVDIRIPFSAQYFEYSTKYTTYIPCRQTATCLADSRLRGLVGVTPGVVVVPGCCDAAMVELWSDERWVVGVTWLGV